MIMMGLHLAGWGKLEWSRYPLSSNHIVKISEAVQLYCKGYEDPSHDLIFCILTHFSYFPCTLARATDGQRQQGHSGLQQYQTLTAAAGQQWTAAVPASVLTFAKKKPSRKKS